MTWRGDHPQFWVFARSAGRTPARAAELGAWTAQICSSPDEVLQLLGGGTSGVPVAEAQIAAAWTGTQLQFHCFYRLPADPDSAGSVGGWEVEPLSGSGDTLAFLNGAGSSSPLAAARIAAVHRDHRDEYFVFHRRWPQPSGAVVWAWQTVGSAEEVRKTVQPTVQAGSDFQVTASPAAPSAFHVFTAPVSVPGSAAAVPVG
jgi:hypothetical protein